MTSTDPGSYANLPTEQLKDLLRRPDIDPGGRKAVEDELDRRFREEYLDNTDEPTHRDEAKPATNRHASRSRGDGEPISPRTTRVDSETSQDARIPSTPPLSEPEQKTPRRHRGRWIAAGAMTILALGGAGVGIALANQGTGRVTYSPSTYSPSTYSPSTYSPSTYSPSTYSPSTQSPSTQSPSAGVGIVRVPLGQVLNVYSSPNLSSAIVSQLANGSSINITCTVTGATVVGYGGSASDLWDYTSSGGYVPDAFVYTGTNQAVAPEC